MGSLSEGGRSSQPSLGHVTDLWGLMGSLSPEGKRGLRGKREIRVYSCCFVLVTKQRVFTLRVSFMEPGPASPQATADSTASVAAELRRGLETLANSSPNLEERKQAAAALKAIEEEEKRADAAKATARSYLTALKPKASLDDSTVKLPPHPQSVAADNQQKLNSPTKQAPTQHKEIADLHVRMEGGIDCE